MESWSELPTCLVLIWVIVLNFQNFTPNFLNLSLFGPISSQFYKFAPNFKNQSFLNLSFAQFKMVGFTPTPWLMLLSILL